MKQTSTSLLCLCMLAVGCAGQDAENQFQPLANVSCGDNGADAAPAVEDAAAPEVDANTPVPVVDAGTPVVDAGTPVVDASTPEVDASMPGPSLGLAHAAPGCAACRNEVCAAYQGVFDLVSACLTNPDPQFAQECIDLMDCAYVNHCGYSATGAPECFCGSADLNACQTAGNANGPCQAQFFAAAHTTSLGELIGRFGDVSLPVGVAYYFLECDRDSCAACTP